MPTEVNSFKVQFNERRHHNNVGVDTHLCGTPAPLVHPTLVVGSRVGHAEARHFAPQTTQDKVWKCHARQSGMSRAYGDEEPFRGKKCIQPVVVHNDNELPKQRRHDVPITDGSGTLAAARRGKEATGLSVGFKSLKHFEARGEAPQYDMETFMNRKQRAGESIARMRNGIGEAAPGDRPFRQAEHEPGYYAKGGLIPGSSIQLRKSAKPERRGGETGNSQNMGGSATGTKRLSYKKKQQLAQEAYDLAQVLSLTQASERQGNEVPSFETRTGAFLVKPEDEAY